MLMLHRQSWPRLYVDLLKLTAKEGYGRPSREGETIELGPAILGCPAPVFGVLVGRGGSAEFARLEQLTYLGGFTPEPLLRVAPRYIRFQEKNGSWPGAYGPRLDYQLRYVVDELVRHPFSRRATALVWREDDAYTVSRQLHKDVPCTLALNFWLGPAGELRCHAHMRSSDLWFGLYYDLPAFAFLQRAVAKALQRSVGQTYLSTTSLHLYTKDVTRAALVQPKFEGELVHVTLPDPVGTSSNFDRWVWLRSWARDQLQEEMS